MDMRINASLVKILRRKKLWSQEELAAACGLSLRTIQRVEGEGQASTETLKALASALEVDSDLLRENDQSSVSYLNLQLGTVLIAVLVAVALFLVWDFTRGNLTASVFASLSMLNAIVCSLFSSLTTKVEANRLEWYFTFGFLRKSVELSDIVENRYVRNKAWWGLGIRLIPGGWLYSVSGLDAVAIKLKNGKVYRIGSDEAEQLNIAIEEGRLSNVA